MRNIGIAIIDDESLVRLGIKSSVAWEEYGYEIVGEADNGQTGLEMIREKHPDIVLLDVCMPGILGTEVAQELRKFSSSTEIIFLTTSDEFAMDAFAVKATDYLLKPFTQSQFNQAMDRAIAFIRQRSSAKIMLRLVGGGLCIEEISQILYFESHGHILQVHLADGTVLETRKSGQEIKDELDKIASGQFASPNKGYLVNLAAVHIIKADYVEIAGQKLPLGKRKYRMFQEIYFRFMFSSTTI